LIWWNPDYMEAEIKILLFGYGNPGRKDDGLGPVLTGLVEKWILKEKINNVFVDSNYQLNIEDAFTIRDYDIVIFADATVETTEDIKLTRILPSDKVNFTMHAVHPAFILDLCQKLYDYAPEVYLLHIKGYEFELNEGLSDQASLNLKKAFVFIQKVIQEPIRYLESIETER